MDRGAWLVYSALNHKESDTTERLSTHCKLWLFVGEKSCHLLICLAPLKPESVL